MHGSHAPEFLIDVHGVQERLIEARLKLIGDDHQLAFIPLERVGGLRVGEAVHVGFGVVLASITHGAGECDKTFELIPLRLEALVHGSPVTNSVQTTAGDDHRLGLAANSVHGLADKMIDHDLHFLVDRVFVEIDERLEQRRRLLAVVPWVFLNLLEQIPVRFVCRVILQHVEDEAFLDGLPHRVEAERLELAVFPFEAKQFQRLGLGCGGEGEGADVVLSPSLLHLCDDLVFQVFLFAAFFLLRFFKAVR